MNQVFQVGDKVRRIRDSHGGMNVGDIATVKSLKDSKGRYDPYHIWLVEYASGHSRSAFELIDSPIQAEIL